MRAISPKKLKRSVSMSNMNLNCFGHFDGIHNLILGKFRFGLALKRAKSVCENEMMLSDEDDLYLPVRALSHSNLKAASDVEEKQWRRAVSSKDLMMVTNRPLNGESEKPEKAQSDGTVAREIDSICGDNMA